MTILFGVGAIESLSGVIEGGSSSAFGGNPSIASGGGSFISCK